jgi:hypothetical protein
MRRFGFTSFLVFWFQVGFSQQGVLFEKTPGWVKEIAYSEKIADTSNIGGGYYYLLIDQQHHAERQETFRRYCIKVVSEKGLQFASSINESYDPSYEKLIFHRVTVKRGEKIINKWSAQKVEVLRREENLDRHVYDGSLSAILNLEDIQPGDIVDYSFTTRGRNPLFKGKFFNTFYLSFDVPLGKIHYSVSALKSRRLQIRNVNTKATLQLREADGLVTHSIEQENVPALLYEDRTPYWFDPNGRIEVSEFKSWEELNGWAEGLFNNTVPKRASVYEKIREIEKGSTQIEDRIRKSIELVQDEIRYLSFSSGVNSYQPHPPEQVFDQRFGDCKDKSFLLSFILQQLGVECIPALVSTDYGKNLNDRLPSPYLLNHCIVKITFNDSTYWVDPTISFQRGRLKSRTIPPYYKALAISKRASGLESIPVSQTTTGMQIKENYSLKEIGKSARLDVVTTFTGDEADNLRQSRQSSSLEEINKRYLNFYATDFPTIEANGSVAFDDDVESNKIVTIETYTIGSFWKYDSSVNQYSAETYARYLSEYLRTPETKLRSRPYSLPYPTNIEQIITLELPEPWSVKDKQETIDCPGFRFVTNTLYNNKTLRLRYFYQIKKESIDTSEVRTYIEKTNQVRNSLTFLFTYIPSSTVSSAFNWPFLLISTMASGALFFGLRKLYDFDPPVVSESYYDQIGGWLILPAIGLVLTPLFTSYQLISTGFFNISHWKIITDPAFATYNPKLGFLVLVELLSGIAITGYAILLNILLWKRRTSLPRLIIFLYAYIVLSLILDNWISGLLQPARTDVQSMKEIARAVIGAAIWIPYFIFSDRAKATFTRRL